MFQEPGRQIGFVDGASLITPTLDDQCSGVSSHPVGPGLCVSPDGPRGRGVPLLRHRGVPEQRSQHRPHSERSLRRVVSDFDR